MPTDPSAAASVLSLGLTISAIATYAVEVYREKEKQQQRKRPREVETEERSVASSQQKKTKNKMVVQSTEGDGDSNPRFKAARRRLKKCGYDVDGREMQEIHCNQQPGCEHLEWIENGFVQCFTEVDGRRARVMDYAPGQQLQPHRHDIDELFEIRGGSVLVSKWVVEEQEEEEEEKKKKKKKGASVATGGVRKTYRLSVGDLIEIPTGTCHGLLCDPKKGLQFHELVGIGEEAFAKRSTEFLLKDGLVLATQEDGH